MVTTLAKRLLTVGAQQLQKYSQFNNAFKTVDVSYQAKKRIPEYKKKLDGLLKARNLSVTGLPLIGKRLVAQAQLVKDKRLTGKWELDELKRELEGVSYAMINIRKKEMKLAGTLIKIPLIKMTHGLNFVLLDRSGQ